MLRWTWVLCWVAVAVGCATPPGPVAPVPAPISPAKIRASRAFADQHRLGPGLAGRHLTGTLSTGDESVIERIVRGTAPPIEGLAFERAGTFDALGHVPDDAIAYVLVDDEARTLRPVAWRDRRTGDVVELNTGYLLRVVDAPGMGTRKGEGGAERFVYGFVWYARWNRILPEPIAKQLDAFYTTGIEHVRGKLEDFRKVAKPTHSGGDLQLVEWNEALLDRMAKWGTKLPAAPYAHLPDSGKVDIRRERFELAIDSGRVLVDDESLAAYRAAQRTEKFFEAVVELDGVPSANAVRDVLLKPFHEPELYDPVDRAILLEATFDGDEPLRLIIDENVEGGFFVPDNGDKEVHVAYSEVDLNFRYNGLIFAKLAHEAHHVVEFRQRPFLARRCWHQRDDVIETLKYLSEFMWWVERYPGDAPAWDWAPINAGIVLASLLEGYFPNSRC